MIVVGFITCNKDTIEPVCSVDDPATALPWLAAIIESAESPGSITVQITQYRYKGEDVFFIKESDNVADKLDIVKNCEGNTICKFGGFAGFNTCPDFEDSASKKEVIWEKE